jgi:DNA-binding CsgD family transcriptional regulator
MQLTKREYQTYMLCGALGFTPEEAADKLHIAANTVKVNIRHIKDKSGWHKMSELSASAVCEFLGIDYCEIRKMILEKIATAMIVMFFLMDFSPVHDMRNNRHYSVRRREFEIEVIYNNTI